MEDRWIPSVVSFQQGAVYTGTSTNYVGTQDTHINYVDNATNFGAALEVEVDKKSTAVQALLRFEDIFGLGIGQVPLGSQINNANLTLFISNPAERGAYGSLYRMLENWDQTTATWSTFTAPGGGIQTDNIQALEVPDAFVANGIPEGFVNVANSTSIGYYTFNVTTALKAWSAGQVNFGWVFDQFSGAGWDFSSSENANALARPQLTVDFDAPAGNGIFAFSTTSINRSEGNFGNTTIQVSVFREAGSLGNATVDYQLATSPGSATLGSDYNFANGTLSFLDGERVKSFNLTFIGDTVIEGNEQINLTLANATGGATIEPAVGNLTVNILDNDVLVNEVFMDPNGVDDGIEFVELLGTPNASLGNIGTPGTHLYFIAFEGDDGAGVGNADIVANLSGVTLGNTGLLVLTDSRTRDANYTIPAGVTHVVIPNFPEWSLENGTASFALILSPTPFTGPNTVDYDLNDDGILDNLPSGAVVLDIIGRTDNGLRDVAPGTSLPPLQVVTQQGNPDAISRINTATNNDLIPNRLFSWYGGNVTTNANPSYDRTNSQGREVTSNTPAGALVTIGALNVPRTIEFSSSTYTGNETVSNSTLTITVNRFGDLSGSSSVNFATSNGTAISGMDFLSTSGTLNFAANQTSATFNITILPDAIPEGFETINLSLSSPSSPFLLGVANATVTIIDDDSIIATFQNGFGNYTGTRDTGLTGWAPDLTNGSDLSISIDQDDRDPTVGNSPRVPTQGLLRFDDLFGSGQGQVPVGAQIYGGFVTVSVTSVSESNAQLPFYRMLQNWDQGTATWQAPNGSIVNGVTPDDVEASSVPDTFVPTPGVSRFVSIPLDLTTLQAWARGADNFGWLITSNSSNGWDFSSSEAFNDAERPKLTLVYTAPVGAGAFTYEYSSYRAVEGDLIANVTVNRVGGSTGNVTVDYTIAAGTATAGADFTAGNFTLAFLDGETTKTFSVTIANDSTIEPNETVLLSLSNATGGASILSSGGANATLTIRNDDVPTGLLLNEISVNPIGADQPFEYLELIGAGNMGLGSVYVVALESDFGANPLTGDAEHVFDLSAFNNGSAGLTVIKAQSGGHTIPSGVTVFTNNDLNANTTQTLENGASTFLLIFSPQATIARFIDYDWNNNGTLELPAGAVILDAVGWGSGNVSDLVYTTANLTQAGNGAVPDAATRFHGNTSASNANAWYNGDLSNVTLADNASILYDLGNASINIPADAILTPGAQNLVNAAPVITSNGGGATANVTAVNPNFNVTTVTETDANIEQAHTFSITGGANSTLFVINPTTGVLSFNPAVYTPPLYPMPGTYEVIVQVIDPAGATDTQTIYTTVNAGPTVTSLMVNSSVDPSMPNTVQSKLTSITVTFGQAVDIASGAFALAGTDPFNNAISVPLAGIIVTGSGTSVITLTFTGVSGVSFGSLNSGIWTLTVENTLVTAISGGPIMTADYTNSNIKRLFGDSNNDGFIDGTDEGAFGSTFGSSTLDAFYDATFDVNNDGFIDGTDESEFGATFGYNL